MALNSPGKSNLSKDKSSLFFSKFQAGGKASFFQNAAKFLRSTVSLPKYGQQRTVMEPEFEMKLPARSTVAGMREWLQDMLKENTRDEMKQDTMRNSRTKVMKNRGVLEATIGFMAHGAPIPFMDQQMIVPPLYSADGKVIEGSDVVEATEGDFCIQRSALFIFLWRSKLLEKKVRAPL